MKPRQDRCKEGWINPKEIAYLYGAIKKETAIAEVRPWIGQKVTVAYFDIVRDLTLIHCTQSAQRHSGLIGRYLEHGIIGEIHPSDDQINDSVWIDVDHAFSRPTTPQDDVATYAPTQIIAEAFKQQGYHGILYCSSLRKNEHNICIFDTAAAECKEREVYCIEELNYGISQV
jgi:RES domain-containing protein